MRGISTSFLFSFLSHGPSRSALSVATASSSVPGCPTLVFR